MPSPDIVRKIIGVAGLTCIALGVSLNAAEPRRARELFETGKRSFGDELFAVAEGQFRQFLKDFPASINAAEAHLLLGESLFYQERWPEAAAALETGRQSSGGKFADAFHFWLGESQARQNHLADALPLYQEVVENYPKSRYRAAAQFGIGDVLFRSGQFAEARAAFAAAHREAPTAEFSAEAIVGLGKVNLAHNDLGAAEANFRDVIANYSKTDALWLARYWLAETRQRQGDLAGALGELRMIAEFKQKIRPRNLRAEASYSIGRIHLVRNEFDLAADAFSRAKQEAKSPDLQTASLLQRAEALVRGGQSDSAIAELRTTEPMTAPVAFRIAELLYGQKKFKDSLDAYRAVSANFSQSDLVGAAHYGAGWSLIELAKPTEAVVEFAQATLSGPSLELKAQAQTKIGDIYLSQREYLRAAENYQVVLDKFSPSSVSDRAQFQIGFTHAEAGNFGEAAAAFETLVLKFPGSAYAPRAQVQIGWARYNLHQFPEARRAWDRFLQNFTTGPLPAEVWLAIAQAWEAETRYVDALSQLDGFAGKFPESPLLPRVKFEHAIVEAKMGNRPQAREELKKFLTDYPSHPLAVHAQFWLAQDLHSEKQFVPAQSAFEAIAEKFPESAFTPEALYWAGRCAASIPNRRKARELFNTLTVKYTASPLCADARFFQADSFTEEDNFGEAIVVFDELIRAYPASPLVDAAYGRKGDCLFTLKRYEEAIASYEKVVASERAGLALRNQAEVRIGDSFRLLGQSADAFLRYANVVYRKPETERETFWFSMAAERAARIKEEQKLWADAVRLWDQLAAANVDASANAKKRADQIRKEHPEEF